MTKKVFSGSELRERVLQVIDPEREVVRPDWVGPIEQLTDIEDLDSYVRSADWSGQAVREVTLMVVGTAAEMLAVSSDEAGLRRLFVSLLSSACPEFGMSFAGALTLIRGYLYSCLYGLHGVSVARAYERDSLAEIHAFWPGFADEYPFLVGVSKAGPGFRSDSMLNGQGIRGWTE
jgi:hypothetical protein